MTDYYEDEDFDSVYANNAILDLANVSLCLQKESLDELLKKDKAKVEKEDESCAWYHGKISRESAESLLKEGLSKLGPRDGLFLVRESTSSEGDFVLSVTHNFRVFQFQLKAIYDGHYRLDEGPIVQGLEKLITYYHGESTGLVTKLTQHCQGSAPPPQSRNMGPTTLLHRAVLEGDENIVENILKHPLCPDVNAKNEWGTTALHDCCKYGYNKIAELLIERKANVEMKDRQGLTPLHRACAANRPEMISVMIIKGKSNTQLSSPKTSWVPMHDAAMRGYVECVKELLKFHAPIWPRAEDEQTPLDLAIKYHRGSCVELLKSDDKRSVKTRREHWYHPNIVRQQAYDLLEESNKMDGLFLVRPSTKPSVHAVITFCHKRNNYNFEVKVKEYTNAKKPVYYIDNGPYFASLEKLIDHYSRQADGMTTRLTASISSGGETIPVEKENDYYNIDENGSNSPKGSIESKLTSVLSSIVSDKQVGFMKAPVPSGRLNLPRRAESSGDMYSEPELKPKSSPPPLPHTHRPPKQQHAARPNLADTKQTSTDKSENPEFKKIIDAKDIKLGSALGEGEFGEVKKAVYHIKDGLLKKKKIDVAVKTFHQNEAGAAFESINREAILMQDLDHTCIVKLYGICQQPFMLVEEFVPKGALSDYLVKKHVDVDPTLYLWASQIASGMQYLEHKKIVHRDLAARNILVESEKQDNREEWSDDEIYNNISFDNSSKDTCASRSPTDVTSSVKEEEMSSASEDNIPSDMCSASEDNMPLAQLSKTWKSKKKCTLKDNEINTNQPILDEDTKRENLRKRKLSFSDIESDEALDNSDLDETYVPKKDDINTSDSENEAKQYCTKPARKKKACKLKQKIKIRNSAWKKSTKSIRRKLFRGICKSTPECIEMLETKRRNQSVKRKPQNAHSPCSLHIKRVMAKSLREKSIKQIIEKYHIKRLDQLLHSNDLERTPVEADGNCFFMSVVKSTNDKVTIEELREKLCCHMIENKEHYLSYLTENHEQDSSNEEQVLSFQKEINIMMQGGNWSMALGDCLPLALANTYNRPVRIYSSNITTPVVDIQPNLTEKNTVDEEFINLAYLAMKGSEHYNGVTDYHGELDTHDELKQNDTVQPNPTNHRSSPDADKSPNVTPHKRASYQSPKRKLSTRKRRRTPETWQRNIRKQKRNSGHNYTSSQGQCIPGKSVKPSNCEKCRFKCNDKFSKEDRLKIFESYYKMACYERQSDFIGHMVDCVSPCKISDFGLSRAYEEESNYYKASKGGRWPIKWYAPECVNFGKFTHATDVWSYGVTLWEMFSYGDQPYEDMKGIEVIQYIETGKRLAKPKDCPDIVYQKMLACWKKDPKDRLTFDDLHRHFQNDPEYASALDIQRTRKALSSSASKRH